MTQDELQSLLLSMMDDLDAIKKGQHYLQIALEQLDNSEENSRVRIELLLSTYLSLADCIFENLSSDFRKLRREFKQKSGNI
ncbi:MAG: hypothetical protein ICV54_16735 [Nostoc sp. C3-bin3]|nr:hypothetical protein [Nostoc sp. C3-bin3]